MQEYRLFSGRCEGCGRMHRAALPPGVPSGQIGPRAQALKAPVAQAAASLSSARVIHMDETRFPREGSANWVWAVVQPTLAVFTILPSRARYVIRDLIGDNPQGVVVSDRYAAYAYVVGPAKFIRSLRVQIDGHPGQALHQAACSGCRCRLVV